jgi:hypothetical protein
MRNAPAVSYPVARSVLAAWAVASLWTVAALCTLLVATKAGQGAWVSAAAIVSCLLLGLAALVQWRKSPVGVLSWDRKQWQFARVGTGVVEPMALQQISVRLDFQWVILVTFCTPSGPNLWIWLNKNADGTHWRRLRCALYARPKRQTPQGPAGSITADGVAA